MYVLSREEEEEEEGNAPCFLSPGWRWVVGGGDVEGVENGEGVGKWVKGYMGFADLNREYEDSFMMNIVRV